MTDTPTSSEPTIAAGVRPSVALARDWHVGWLFGLVATAALCLAAAGRMGSGVAAALAVGVLPGIFGLVWKPGLHGRLSLPVVWALGSLAAQALAGGVSGPLGVWSLTPLLAGALTGATAEGAVLAAATVGAGVLLTLSGLERPVGDLLVARVLTIASLAVLGCAVGALLIARFTRRERAASAPAVPVAAASELGGERRLAAAELARDRAFEALVEAEKRRDDAETARAQAEAHAQNRSRFLANMSHELRTPLNAIMGFSDVMRARMFGDLPPKYAEYADLIHDAGRHLMDLINDVLDMSKIEAERYTLSRELFDARDAVNAALRLVRLQADEAGVQLRGVLPPKPLIVDADRRALKQIVLNLVSNALKFTPRGGSVIVTAQAAENAFELVVADTGVGIAKADLDRLGKPFEQAGDAERKAQGTGLGLSLVRAFANLHGGDMSIESELGEGAAVTVRLPVLVAPEPTGDAHRSAEVIPLNLPRSGQSG